MEYHRKLAKALVRAHRAGEADATRRAHAVLGSRAAERFLLSDAQYVVAREQGFRTWKELRQVQDAAPEWVEGEDVVLSTGLEYAPGEPVEVVVRKRSWKFDLSDSGRAVELAGRPSGWRDVAEPIVNEQYFINVNRRGVVFVQSNALRLNSLATRVAECSRAVYAALLELGE